MSVNAIIAKVQEQVVLDNLKTYQDLFTKHLGKISEQKNRPVNFYETIAASCEFVEICREDLEKDAAIKISGKFKKELALILLKEHLDEKDFDRDQLSKIIEVYLQISKNRWIIQKQVSETTIPKSIFTLGRKKKQKKTKKEHD